MVVDEDNVQVFLDSIYLLGITSYSMFSIPLEDDIWDEHVELEKLNDKY